MKIPHVLAALLLVQTATAVAAAPAADAAPASAVEGFQISPRIGKSTLTVKPGIVQSGQTGSFDALLSGIDLSYTLPGGPMAEIGYGSQGNWSWFGTQDAYRLREYSLAVGFQIHTPRDFLITPKVGRSSWDLSSQDVVFRNPDAGHGDRISGYQNFWELSLQKQIRHAAALGVTYKDNHYDFGSVRSIAFTASFYL